MANAPKAQVDAKTAAASNATDMPDFDKWDDIQIGFAPYWHPEVGSWIYAQIIGKDARDPNFVRYQFKALKDTQCRRGPSNEDEKDGPVGEDVMVKTGETFSMSVYYSLTDEFDFHLYVSAHTGSPVPIRVDALKKVPTKKFNVWNFRARVSPETTRLLAPKRDAWRQLKNEGGERPQLAD